MKPTKKAPDSSQSSGGGWSRSKTKVLTRSQLNPVKGSDSEEEEAPEIGELRHLDGAAARLDSSGLCTYPGGPFKDTVRPDEKKGPTAKALKRLTMRFDWRNYVLYNEEDVLKDEV